MSSCGMQACLLKALQRGSAFQSCQNDSHRFCTLTMPEAGIFVSNNSENNLSRPIKSWLVFAPIFRTTCGFNGSVGGPARIRTYDQRIMSPRFAGCQSVANPCGIRTTF